MSTQCRAAATINRSCEGGVILTQQTQEEGHGAECPGNPGPHQTVSGKVPGHPSSIKPSVGEGVGDPG